MAKPESEELESRIEYTLFLLSRRLYKSDIKKMLKRKYSIGARTCENYLSRARERIIASTGKSKEDHRIESLKFYESIIAGPDSTLRDRCYAQERLDKLLGLEAPQQHDVTNKGEYLFQVIEAVVEKEDSSNGKPDHQDASGPEGLPQKQ